MNRREPLQVGRPEIRCDAVAKANGSEPYAADLYPENLLWAGAVRRRWDMLGFAALYVLSLAMWALSGKPIQFYYHYLLPGTFLMVCLALALDDLWRRRTDELRWIAPLSLLASAAMFAWFYPIISAAPLCCGRPSYIQWMWLDSWR